MHFVEQIASFIYTAGAFALLILFGVWLYVEYQIKREQREIDSDPDLRVSFAERQKKSVREKCEDKYWIVYSLKKFFRGE